MERADLPFFIGLMAHMAERGITCPRPVADKVGAVLQEVGGRAAAIVTFLEGTWSNTPSVARCQAVGEVLARMHLAGGDFAIKRANALNVTAHPRSV